MMEKSNLTMLTDFYEITMANGYFCTDMADNIACFDMFFRRIPDDGGYAIMAGLEQVIEYLENLEFTDEDIEYLRKQKMFSEDFLKYLSEFKFTCDVWAIPEGTPIFPGEPILTVRGPPPEPDRNKSEQDRSCCSRASCNGIWHEKSARHSGRSIRCACCIYRWMCRDSMYDFRS